jgi:serine/threonine-protein kinase RsbT
MNVRHAPEPGHLLAATLEVLSRYVSAPTARSVLDVGLRRAGLRREALGRAEFPQLLAALQAGLRLFLPGEDRVAECVAQLGVLHTQPEHEGAAREPPEALASTVVVKVSDETDVGRARSAARVIARRAGFTENGATRLATLVCELARNIARYAGAGEITQRVIERPERAVEVSAADRGPGIADLSAVLNGTYRSRTGMGLGLRGVQRLADHFHVETVVGHGTRVTARMRAQ